MSYHAIGKEEWDKLPSLFYDKECAKDLDEDCWWWAYTYMFPMTSQPGKTTGFECYIKFTNSDHTFKKVLKPLPIS